MCRWRIGCCCITRWALSVCLHPPSALIGWFAKKDTTLELRCWAQHRPADGFTHEPSSAVTTEAVRVERHPSLKFPHQPRSHLLLCSPTPAYGNQWGGQLNLHSMKVPHSHIHSITCLKEPACDYIALPNKQCSIMAGKLKRISLVLLSWNNLHQGSTVIMNAERELLKSNFKGVRSSCFMPEKQQHLHR